MSSSFYFDKNTRNLFSVGLYGRPVIHYLHNSAMNAQLCYQFRQIRKGFKVRLRDLIHENMAGGPRSKSGICSIGTFLPCVDFKDFMLPEKLLGRI